MQIVNRFKLAAATLFGYDAVESTGRRKPPAAHRRPEDRELTASQRIVLSNATRDLQRNFAIAAWAVRKHLDYVSTFTFQSNSGDDVFDDELERMMLQYDLPANFDAAGRLSRNRYLRMAEARRVLDGDVFINFLKDGRNQGIEGDRVIDPKHEAALKLADANARRRYEHGVLIDGLGRALAFAVHRRSLNGGVGLEFDAMLDAAFCYHHGYYDRFDQVRGISPLSTACNPLRDVYENFDYALAKAKVSQLFALAIYRDAADEVGIESTKPATEDADGEERYEVSFGKGPFKLELDPKDRAEFLESKNPSSEFQSFTNLTIGVALKALDIPFSFYDEAHTNYSGQRQAWIQYDESAEVKREDNRALLNWITARRIALFVRDGELTLPRGMTLDNVLSGCAWISRGIPWIDPLKEITADVAAIKAGQLGPETSCRQRGLDVYKMIDERARVEQYARDKGVVLEYDVESLAAANAVANSQVESTKNNREDAK